MRPFTPAAVVVLFGWLGIAVADETTERPGWLYPSSVVGTDFDFIRAEDPSAFTALKFTGRAKAEMPDKTRRDLPLVRVAFCFQASFRDGARIHVAVDTRFGTEAAARAEAARYMPRLGKLPSALRLGVKRLVVHGGTTDATAFSDEGLIVVYATNATKRIKTHDLEETIFHEAVHAAWDKRHARSAAWRKAQAKDGGFATRYGKRRPAREDLAESALFAFTLIHHPGRIPAAEAARIRKAIPARIAFVERLLPRGKPLIAKATTRPLPGRTRVRRPARKRLAKPAVCSRHCALRTLDLTTAVGVSDILSNALTLGLGKSEDRVRTFLERKKRIPQLSAETLLQATAKRFDLARDVLDQTVTRFLHCNCRRRRRR